MLSNVVSVEFDATDQLLFLYFTFVKYLRKNKPNDSVHQLVSSVVLYNTVNQFGIHMIRVRQIKLYLNNTYCRYRLG